jgi:anaerobic ribonucleoside-triphosphate reductase activating protein
MRYHNITHDDMLNGDGLRVVLWVAGCTHCCKGCQNPLTWDPDGGLEFDESAKQEIFDQLEKSYISGITFSGGDPLHSANRFEVRNLMAEIKAKYPDKTIWLYTGDSWENIMHYAIMQYVDVLVDGEFEVAKKDIKLLWKGSSNQRVIDVQKSLKQTDPSIPILHCNDYAK